MLSRALSVIAVVATGAMVSAQTHPVGIEFDQLYPNLDFINSGSTGTVNDGFPTAGVGLVTGAIGAGINLPGGADEVMAGPSPLLGSQPRTISVWARTTVTSGLVTAMTLGSNGFGPKWDMDIDCDNGGVFELGVGGGRTTGQGPALNDGAWHMMTTVLPSGATTLGGVRLFVDGEFVYTNSGTRVIATTNGPVIIGRSANSPGFQAFTGDVDDVVIWSEPLTDAQVKCLYDVATEPTLGYSATEFEQLLEVFRNNLPTVTVQGRTWTRVASSSTSGLPAGLSTLPNGTFQLLMDSTGTFVREAPPASFTAFGAGCAGSAGTPTLSSSALPLVNQMFSAQVSNIPAGTSAWGVLSLTGSLIPLDLIGMPGCSTIDTHMVTLPLTPSGGVANIDVLLPFEAVGHTIFEQGFVLDPPANAFGLTSTNAAAMLVGL